MARQKTFIQAIHSTVPSYQNHFRFWDQYLSRMNFTPHLTIFLCTVHPCRCWFEFGYCSSRGNTGRCKNTTHMIIFVETSRPSKLCIHVLTRVENWSPNFGVSGIVVRNHSDTIPKCMEDWLIDFGALDQAGCKIPHRRNNYHYRNVAVIGQFNYAYKQAGRKVR